MDIDQRLFDLGVSTVIVALLLILLYIGWNNGWKSYQKYVLHPRREREKQALLAKEREVASRAGETKALEVLRAAGFEFEGRNQEADFHVAVDGKLEKYKVKAELIVKKGGAKYVAEVKTGALGTSTRNGATRRELLEFSLVYPVAGILLVDMKTRKVQLVNFPNYKLDPKPRLDNSAMIVTLIAGMIIGASATVLFARVLWPFIEPIAGGGP